jgi:sulfur-carrier protein
VKLLYFAWLRTRIGTAEETLEPPQGVRSVAALVDWLEARGPVYAAALNNRKLLRVAVNKEYVGWDHPIAPGDEVALFPPVTGG